MSRTKGGDVIEVKSVSTPEELRAFDGGRMEIVWVGGTTVVRATFDPGFRWSVALKPRAGTDSCQLRHMGYVVSGQICFAMDQNDDEVILSPGVVFAVQPGHDTWVVGDEPAVVIDFTGDDHLAKMLEWSGT